VGHKQDRAKKLRDDKEILAVQTRGVNIELCSTHEKGKKNYPCWRTQSRHEEILEKSIRHKGIGLKRKSEGVCFKPSSSREGLYGKGPEV